MNRLTCTSYLIHFALQEFEIKLECVKDMLEEFVETSAAVMVTTAAAPLAAKDSATGPTTVPTAINSLTTNPGTGKLPLQVLQDVIHKELESRRAAVIARKAALEAEERAAKEKEAGRGAVTGSGGSGGGAGRNTVGIAEQHHHNTSSAMAHSASERASVVRQHQLEKMVKALVARQEKVHFLSTYLLLLSLPSPFGVIYVSFQSNAEIKRKNELLDKYVRIINQFQKDCPNAKLTALDGSTMSVGPAEGDVHVNMPVPVRRSNSRGAFAESTIHSVPSMETVEEGDLNAESEGADGSEKEAQSGALKLDLAAAAVAASGTGGGVSSFRKPAPTSAPTGAAGGMMSPPRSSNSAQQQGMPSSPGAAVRTGSGGASSALRKSSLANLPPRSKHHSTTTLEVLQKNAKL